MTYAIGRPSWATGTAIKAAGRNAVVHMAAGWSAHEGTATVCGRVLLRVEHQHVAGRTSVDLTRAFPDVNVCARCQRMLDRKAK